MDILYLTWNRREYTRFTFDMLIRNTNWDLVDRLVVYDDSSTDGAREEVETRLGDIPVPSVLHVHDLGSPVAVMNDYLSWADSELFAKVDNDVAMPPRWLEAFLSVMESRDSPDLLGTESPFMGPPPLDWDGTYTWHGWRHIGGVGVMRTEFFRRTGPMEVVEIHHGFTQHQWRHRPRRGWINPDLAACLLDRCPIEPWLSLSREYELRGWQRPWKKIPMQMDYYWRWFTPSPTEEHDTKAP